MTIQEAQRTFERHYQDLGYLISTQAIGELEGQGHRATGKLVRSVVMKVRRVLDEIEAALEHYSYGLILNSGVTPERIPYSRGSGARTSAFIAGLMAWIRFKGIAGGLDKKVQSIAFAMANAMKRDGSPTRGSYRFTANGRRLGWIDHVYNHYSASWEDRMEEISDEYVNNVVEAYLSTLAKRYKYLEFSLN